jgi:hypothetical protein
MKRWIIAAVAAAGVMLFPAGASAAVCGDDGTTKLFDSQGYFWDFSESNPTAADHNDPFGTFEDSGSNDPTGTPPGPVDNDDTYDDFGQLFVGGTDNSHMYWSPDNNSCTDPAAGEHDYPVLPLAGLNVQRKVFVSPTNPLTGARILDLLSNPGAAPITTTVQVGDLNSGNNDDDLGSDDLTGVRASSNGDTVASPADFWAVTNDDPVTTDDNTIAHIVDGQGGKVKASLFQIGGGTVATEQPEDNVAWGWTVTVPPQGTVGLMSVQVQRGDAGHPSSGEVAAAVAAANAYESAPQANLYEGMNPAEAATIANWPQPPVKKKKKCKKHKKHHGKKSAAAAKKHKKSKKCKKHKKKHHK